MKKIVVALVLMFGCLATAQELSKDAVIEIGVIGDAKNFRIRTYFGPDQQNPAQDMTWERLSGNRVAFVVVPTQEYMVSKEGFKLGKIKLSPKDPLFNTYGSTFSNYNELEQWAEDSLGESDGDVVSSPGSGASTERPENASTGESFFDSTLGYPIWYNGTNWVTSAGVDEPDVVVELAYNPNLIEIGGQSNAFGFAPSSGLPGELSIPITGAYMAIGGKDGSYESMTLETLSYTNSKGWNGTNTFGNFGIELRLAEVLVDTFGEDFYFIKTSEGSTGLETVAAADWNINSVDDLYLDSNGHHDAAVALMPSQLAPAYYVWIQGEEDIQQDNLDTYQANLEAFIAAKRAYYNYPQMPFLICRMSNNQTLYTELQRNTIRAIQETVAAQPYNVLIDTDAATTQADNVHYNASGINTIALEVAEAIGVNIDQLGTELTGTSFSSPYYLEGSNDVYSDEKAFDNNTSTFFSSEGSGGSINKYIGLDLGVGNEKVITKVYIYPRTSFGDRSHNLTPQGSNTSTTDGFVDIGPSTGTDPVSGEYTKLIITDTTPYRYIRMYGEVADLDVAEVKFYGY
ncbi:sialate O-acetylesterase [Maribacter sp. Hel_I_7]|uniref:sialate O-acetylesterase n=1 Tax=Maribacter sp. Hel_I_7 TaxID=1249997 RepID=UPI000563910A|nr:sialate O-acetylesterase [Maribacter sp. Hel_I_7]